MHTPPKKKKTASAGRKPAAKPSPVTLKDITRVTGFTVNTVSRALKGKGDISLKTQKMIQREARRMGYIPNALAASLRSGKTRMISVIIPDISDPLFAIFVRDIEAKLKERHFDLFIQNTNEDDELERRAVMASIGKKMDGIIICPFQKSIRALEIMGANQVPFVLLGRRYSRHGFNYVVADDQRGGYLATQHLIDRGHRDILFLNAPQYISSARERLQGYRKALRENGIEYRGGLVHEVKIAAGECARTLEGLLGKKTRFSSIFCFSDLMAWETIAFLQSKGLSIPGDVAIVGFDDIQSRLYYPYPLTSVGYGKQRIASRSVDMLMDMIEGPEKSAALKEIVDVALVVRNST